MARFAAIGPDRRCRPGRRNSAEIAERIQAALAALPLPPRVILMREIEDMMRINRAMGVSKAPSRAACSARKAERASPTVEEQIGPRPAKGRPMTQPSDDLVRYADGDRSGTGWLERRLAEDPEALAVVEGSIAHDWVRALADRGSQAGGHTVRGWLASSRPRTLPTHRRRAAGG
jgi:hypothetical protein